MASYGLDQLQGDAELMEIACFAAQLCETPVAMVNLIEEHDQLLLADFGAPDGPSVARSDNLCAYSMYKSGFVEFRDTTAEPDVAGFAAVTHAPKVRFYAAWPLVSSEGAPLGALCVSDLAVRPEGLTKLQRDGLKVLAAAVMRRIGSHREKAAAEKAQALSEQRFRIFADSIPDVAWSSDASGHFYFFNQRWFELLGLDSMPEGGWRVLFHPDERERAVRDWEEAFANGTALETEFRILTADGEYRWVLCRSVPVRDEAGEITDWYGTITDIDEQRRLSEERAWLAGELAHRIKNIFSVIGGLISLNARGDNKLEAFAANLHENIQALSRAQDFALQLESATEGQLKSLLGILMAPYGAPGKSAVTISGDDIEAGPRAATPFALVIHELATNSAKYGALSVADGQVVIHVTQDEEAVHVSWHESHGPSVREPETSGFGSRLVKMAVEHQLGGTIERDWRPEGLALEIVIPAERLAQ